MIVCTEVTLDPCLVKIKKIFSLCKYWTLASKFALTTTNYKHFLWSFPSISRKLGFIISVAQEAEMLLSKFRVIWLRSFQLERLLSDTIKLLTLYYQDRYTVKCFYYSSVLMLQEHININIQLVRSWASEWTFCDRVYTFRNCLLFQSVKIDLTSYIASGKKCNVIRSVVSNLIAFEGVVFFSTYKEVKEQNARKTSWCSESDNRLVI